MQKMNKPIEAWCVKHSDGELMLYGIGRSEPAAYMSFMDSNLSPPESISSQEKIEAQGYRCVKVEIKEVKNEQKTNPTADNRKIPSI